jgi:hypothetical protein
MFGTFQQSSLRIEIAASADVLRENLTRPRQIQQWLRFQRFSAGLPDRLATGTVYTSWTGPIAIQHQVEIAESNRIRLLLSQGIDGFHEWAWGEGWVQSRIEGISILPISLGQTASLLCLKQFLATASSS